MLEGEGIQSCVFVVAGVQWNELSLLFQSLYFHFQFKNTPFGIISYLCILIRCLTVSTLGKRNV